MTPEELQFRIDQIRRRIEEQDNCRCGKDQCIRDIFRGEEWRQVQVEFVDELTKSGYDPIQATTELITEADALCVMALLTSETILGVKVFTCYRFAVLAYDIGRLNSEPDIASP